MLCKHQTAFQNLLTIAPSQWLIPTQTNQQNIFFQIQAVVHTKGQVFELTQQIHKEFNNVFNGIGCFEGTFSLQLKLDSRPYEATPRHVEYALQKPFKDKLDRLQQQDIIAPLRGDEMLE